MPQSFQVISQVQIPEVMHGACCQISWLEELSVLLPGYSVGFYDILQAIQEATATSLPAGCTNNSDTRLPLDWMLLPSCAQQILQHPSQFFLHFLLSSCFAKVTIFWLVTPILLSHQLPLSTAAPSGHTTILYTSWYAVPFLCLFSLYIAELFKFLQRTQFQYPVVSSSIHYFKPLLVFVSKIHWDMKFVLS